MNDVNHKRQLLGQFAAVAKALGHEYRLELLEFVAQGERSVEALTRLTELPVATVSQHLQQLRRAGLVQARKEGKYVYYRLAGDEVVTLLDDLRTVAERNVAEVRLLVEQYFRCSDELEAIPAAELLERLRSGTVTLLDVRPSEEFAAGHLPGAINIPLDELERRLRELPAGREVVAYCRGPYCALSHEAVQLLRREGLKALRFEQGYPEWKAAGMPVRH